MTTDDLTYGIKFWHVCDSTYRFMVLNNTQSSSQSNTELMLKRNQRDKHFSEREFKSQRDRVTYICETGKIKA